jgi:Uma2 family endonuclease
MHNLAPDILRIPRQAQDLAGFRSWAASDRFPERGRIDYLAGRIEVEMSPEELNTHGLVKAEIGAVLHFLVARAGRGEIYIDRARISSPRADLSVEPDVVVALWDSLDSGRLRKVPTASGEPDRFIEMEGAPDLVVEVVSETSVGKDLHRLPPLYALAGVPELWLIDARGERLRFHLLRLASNGYERVMPDVRGWARSPRLGAKFRLARREPRPGCRAYRLEHS